MNNYCVETAEETGKSYTHDRTAGTEAGRSEAIVGTYHLNGVQATSYCRIRYTASLDMGRTERQRRVIQMIVDKAKNAGLSTIFNIMDQVFPDGQDICFQKRDPEADPDNDRIQY